MVCRHYPFQKQYGLYYLVTRTSHDTFISRFGGVSISRHLSSAILQKKDL